jgi:hypothetical protein
MEIGYDMQNTNISHRVPAIFLLEISPEGIIRHQHTQPLHGNPLDIVITPRADVIVSLDCVREPGSTKVVLKSESMPTGIIRFGLSQGLFQDGEIGTDLDTVEVSSGGEALSRLLYNVENLRKHSGDDE